MRIAVIGTRGHDPATHGIEETLREVLPRLAERGHEIDVLSERNGRSIGPIDGARVIRLPGTGEAFGHAMVSSLISAFRGYDVVNFCSAEAGGLFSMAAKMGLHRVVVSVHGLSGPWGAGALSAQSPFAPEAAAARFADAITVVSRRLERHFRTLYGRDTVYIPNGVSAAGRLPSPNMLGGLDLAPQGYVLLADRLTPASGAHLAVAAANAVNARFPLVVAETAEGDGEYRARLLHDADPAKVVFAGQVRGGLLDALLAHAHLYLLPAQGEEAPALLKQALAHGRAVVVSDQPEHLDVVGADGFTFTTGDAGDLRRVLAWLLEDPEVVARMRVRAAATAATRYCWDRIAEAYEKVFASVL